MPEDTEETLDRKPLQIISSANSNYVLIPEGVYETNITKAVEKTQFNRFNNQDETGINVVFTIVEEGEVEGKEGTLFFTPFLTANSKLTKLVKAVMGRDFNAEELATIKDLPDLEKFLIGKPVKILVKNRTSAKGNEYYNITDFVKSSRFGKKVKEVEGVDESTAAAVFNNPPQEEVDPQAPSGAEDLSQEEIDKIDEDLNAGGASNVAKATPKTTVQT